MSATTVTVVGNLSRDPDAAVHGVGPPGRVSFGLAVGRRRKDGDTWVDDGVDWYDVTAWGDLAENVCDSLEKGQRAVVTGRLSQRTWETKDGVEKLSVTLTADDIGPSLRWATSTTTKTDRRKATADDNAASSYDSSEEPFDEGVGRAA